MSMMKARKKNIKVLKKRLKDVELKINKGIGLEKDERSLLIDLGNYYNGVYVMVSIEPIDENELNDNTAFMDALLLYGAKDVLAVEEFSYRFDKKNSSFPFSEIIFVCSLMIAGAAFLASPLLALPKNSEAVLMGNVVVSAINVTLGVAYLILGIFRIRKWPEMFRMLKKNKTAVESGGHATELP